MAQLISDGVPMQTIIRTQKYMIEEDRKTKNRVEKIIYKRERTRKSGKQHELLMTHYRRNPKWDRKKLEELKQLTGLKIAQIYKWMWDTKKREEKEAEKRAAEAKTAAGKKASNVVRKALPSAVKRMSMSNGGTGESADERSKN